MCFHHICPDCIYSSCSEQVPKPSLLQTDGTITLSSFFTSVPHREQTDGGMNNAEEMTSAERIDAMRAANQITEKMNIWIRVWVTRGSLRLVFQHEFMLMKVHAYPSGAALKPTSCNFQWFWLSESGLAPFWIRSQHFFCNHQILRNFCWTEKVLLSYLAHSSNAGLPLIFLASISHISSRSQSSILPLFNLHSQFPSLINSNFFPSYSSFSLCLEVHYKKHSHTRRNDADKFLRVGGAKPVETERKLQKLNET